MRTKEESKYEKYGKKYKQTHRESINAYKRSYYKSHPDEARRSRLKKLGWTPEIYNEALVQD